MNTCAACDAVVPDGEPHFCGVDISAELHALCDKLGLDDYDAISSIRLNPQYFAAEIYKRNENGEKYCEKPGWAPAMELRTGLVRT